MSPFAQPFARPSHRARRRRPQTASAAALAATIASAENREPSGNLMPSATPAARPCRSLPNGVPWGSRGRRRAAPPGARAMAGPAASRRSVAGRPAACMPARAARPWGGATACGGTACARTTPSPPMPVAPRRCGGCGRSPAHWTNCACGCWRKHQFRPRSSVNRKSGPSALRLGAPTWAMARSTSRVRMLSALLAPAVPPATVA